MQRCLIIILFSVGFLAKAQEPGDRIFQSDLIHTVRMTIDTKNFWDSLAYYKAFRDSTDSTIYLPTRLEFDSIVLDTIGVRWKGVGSYGHPGNKKPWKLDFNSFVDGQKLDGLTKLNLQNSTFDPTQVREKLMLDFCAKHNIPASRCTYAEVYVNDQYLGLYKIIEQIDKRFLDRTFDNKKGNLYKGENGKMIWRGPRPEDYADQFQKDNNEEENDWIDLIHLLDVVNNSSDETFHQELDSVFNTSAYLRSWATYNVLVSLDSYLYLSHNYYIYHNKETDKFDWIMWDLSLGFGAFPILTEHRLKNFDIMHTPFMPDYYTRPLNRRMMEVPQYQEEYLGYVCEFLYSDLNPQVLFPKIDSLYERIKPSVYKELEHNQMYTLDEFEGNYTIETVSEQYRSSIPGLKEFITERRSSVQDQLCQLGFSCVDLKYTGITDELIKTYPNPTNEQITFEFYTPDVMAKEIKFSVVNSLGQEVLSEELVLNNQRATNTYNTSLFPQGIYYIQFPQMGCNKSTGKFVVVH